jgi:hypothetical protein
MKLPKLPSIAQLKPRERLLASGAAAVLLLVGLDRLVLSPWIRHTRTIRQETRTMTRALKSHSRLLTRETRVLADLERHRQYLRPAIADDLQMAALLNEMEKMAQESQVLLKEVKPLPTESTESTRRYTLDVRFACTMEEWVEFVYRIETSPSLYQVVRATLTKQEEVEDRLAGSVRVISSAVVPKQLAEAEADGAPKQTTR